MYLEKMKDKSRSSFKMILAYTLISQLLILVRTNILMEGTDKFFKAEEFMAAFLSLTYVTELVAGGILLAIIPLSFKNRKDYGFDNTIDYLNNIVNITTVVGTVLMFLGFIFAKDIVRMTDDSMTQEKFLLSVKLFRVGLPMIMIILIKPIHLGFLQVNHAFKSGSKGGVYYNLVLAIYLVFFRRHDNLGLMLATILAYASYYLIIVGALRTYKFELRKILDFRDRRVREFIYTVLLTTLYTLVRRTAFELDAKLLSDSANIFGFMGNAVYVVDYISILFASIVSTISYPIMSELYYESRDQEFAIVLNKILASLVRVLVPVSLVLIIFAEPTVKLFFVGGTRFLFKDKGLTAYELLGTTRSLRFIAMGILFIGLNLVLVRSLFARGDFKGPVIIASIGLGLNYLLARIFINLIGEEGIGLALALSVTIVGIMYIHRINKDKLLIDIRGLIENILSSMAFGLLAAIPVYLSYILMGRTNQGIILGYILAVIACRLIYKKLNKTREVI